MLPIITKVFRNSRLCILVYKKLVAFQRELLVNVPQEEFLKLIVKNRSARRAGRTPSVAKKR